MVRLANITRNNGSITCDIFPEDSPSAGHLTVAIESGEFVYSLPEGYEWCKSHVGHARRTLLQLASENRIPSRKLIMWY